MAKARITLGLAIFITALAVIGRAYPEIAIPLMLVAMFLIVWGRQPRTTESFIGGLPAGKYIIKFLHQIDLVISPRDEKYEQHLRELISNYPPPVRASLILLRKTRTGTSIPEAHWQQFRHDGLVEHPHSGPGPIKEELREMIGRILDDLSLT